MGYGSCAPTQVDDAPIDAIDATRSGGHGKSGFLACLSCGLATVAPAAAVADDLRRALRTMRLFRPGAVGLHAHGWAKRIRAAGSASAPESAARGRGATG